MHRLKPGQVCQITSVHHPSFSKQIGQEVVIARIDGEIAYVSKNEPIEYRLSRRGERVTKRDPRCIQTLMHISNLTPIIGKAPVFSMRG